MHGPADAVVGDARLGVVVGAHLLRAVAGGDHGLALGGEFLHVFVVLALVEAGAEDGDSLLLVLDLGLLVLHGNDDASGDMCQTHSTIGSVDALAAGAGGAEGVDAHVAHVQLDVELLGFGQHHHACGGGVDAALGLGGGDALDAVHSRFVFQQTVGTVAGDGEGDVLVAAGGALVEVVDFYFPMLLLAEAGVHAEEVAGEDAGLVAAGAATDFDDGILGVGGVGGDEEEADVVLHGLAALLGGGELLLRHLAQLGVFLGLEQFLALGDGVEERLVFVVGLNHGLQVLVIFRQFDVAFHVRSDLRVVHLLLNLLITSVYGF